MKGHSQEYRFYSKCKWCFTNMVSSSRAKLETRYSSCLARLPSGPLKTLPVGITNTTFKFNVTQNPPTWEHFSAELILIVPWSPTTCFTNPSSLLECLLSTLLCSSLSYPPDFLFTLCSVIMGKTCHGYPSLTPYMAWVTKYKLKYDPFQLFSFSNLHRQLRNVPHLVSCSRVLSKAWHFYSSSKCWEIAKIGSMKR